MIAQLEEKIKQYEQEINDNEMVMSQMENTINELKMKLHSSKAPAHRDDIDVQKICELYQSGFSQCRIAKEIGCSRGTVKTRLIECGLLK